MAAPDLILDHPGCRIWRASDALSTLLPDEGVVPRHCPLREGSSIDAVNRDGVSYITCRGGVWHVDGFNMMAFVVAQGSLKLQIGHLTGDSWQGYGERDVSWITVEAEHTLTRGDAFVLWGLYAHRAIGAGDMTLVNIDCNVPMKRWLELSEHFNIYNRDIGKPKLYSPRFTERILISHLKDPKLVPDRKKLWQKYSSALNAR